MLREMTDLELSQLKYFVVVAKQENMSRAAEMLFVSQPDLSTSISKLEAELGVPLFDRRRGKIILNQNGERLLESVAQALNILDTGIQSLREQHFNAQRKPLFVSCMVDDSLLITEFILQHPEINVYHHRDDLPTITEMLLNRDVDLALTVLPPPNAEIVFKVLYKCNYVIMLNKNHPLASKERIVYQQLENEHFVIDDMRVNKSMFCNEAQKHGLYPIIDYDVRSLSVLMKLIERNSHISVLPFVKYKEAVLQGNYPSVICRQFADSAPKAFWGIAYNKNISLTESGITFRDFAKKYFETIDLSYRDKMDYEN